MFGSFGLIFYQSNLRVIVFIIPNSFLFLFDQLDFDHTYKSLVFSKQISTV